MAILFWKKKSTKDAFRLRYIEKVRERHPNVEYELDAEYGVNWKGFENHKVVNVWLESGFKEFSDDPSDGENILDRWVNLLENLIDPIEKPLDLSCLVPMVRHNTWLEDQQSHRDSALDKNKNWTEAYNDELVVFFVEKNESIVFVSVDRALSSGKSLNDLRTIAIQNLGRLTSGWPVAGEEGRYIVGDGSSLDASLILNEQIFKDARLRIHGKWIVGIPDRNTLLVSDTGLPTQVFRTTLSVRDLHRTESYPVSPHLFIRNGERFEVLDSDSDDDEHPIPKLFVLDIHATKKEGGAVLCIVIASPLQSDARSMYRLAVKLDSYLQHILSPDFVAESGKADESNTIIEVNIHQDSSDEVFELLDSITEWIAKRGATLKVKRFNSSSESSET